MANPSKVIEKEIPDGAPRVKPKSITGQEETRAGEVELTGALTQADENSPRPALGQPRKLGDNVIYAGECPDIANGPRFGCKHSSGWVRGREPDNTQVQICNTCLSRLKR